MGFLSKGDFTPIDKKRGVPKTASKGIYKGKYRTQIVHLKIKNKAPFNLGIDGTGDNVVGLRLLTKSGKWFLVLMLLLTKKLSTLIGVIN
jgi:hypothetical protein